MLVLIMACGLVACKRSAHAPDESAPPPPPSPAVSGSSTDLLKTQRQDLQKAKEVGDVQMKAAADQQKAIDDATGK